MIQSQSFIIKKKGKVKGGSANYVLDTASGSIQWSASVNVGIGFFTHNYEKSGTYIVDPELLKSVRVKQVGDKTQIGNAKFTVTSVSPGACAVDVDIEGEDMSGVGTLDTTGEVIRISELDAIATVSVVGISLHLEFDAMDTPLKYVARKTLWRKFVEHYFS